MAKQSNTQGSNRCSECGQNFGSPNELQEHQKNQHQSSKTSTSDMRK